MMRAMMLVLLAMSLLPMQAMATPSQDIARLIAALGESGCEFERNGSWHSAARAQAHLQRKYAWLRERDLAPTPELFIERAATESSRSGKPYRVRCPGKPVVPSAQWFRERLDALRRP